MALSRMRTWSRVVTFSPLNALRIVTSLTLWMFLNRLRMLSSTNIFFSLLIFPSILILVVWGDGIEPPGAGSSFRLLRRYQPTLFTRDSDTRMKESRRPPFIYVFPHCVTYPLSFILICVARDGIEPPTARGFYSTRYPYTYRLAMIKQRISQ